MATYNEKEFVQYVDKVFEEALRPKLRRIGELVVERAKQTLRANLGKDSKLAETLHYKIIGLDVMVYSNNEILLFIEKGTKPHVIRAKDGKSLAFGWPNAPRGMKPGAGGKYFFKEIHHPGTKEKPFLSQALFLSKNEIMEIIQE